MNYLPPFLFLSVVQKRKERGASDLVKLGFTAKSLFDDTAGILYEIINVISAKDIYCLIELTRFR